MELHAGERPVPHLRDDALGARRRRGRLGGVGVREPERLWLTATNFGPADPRHPALAKPDRAAGDEAETGHAAVLLALLEREVEAEADAERRSGSRAERLVDARLL